MSMIEDVRESMVKAMRVKEKETKDSLSMLLAALQNKQIEKRSELTEAEEFEVVKKEIKQTKEMMESAPADREDIKEMCQNRLDVYAAFAPEEMSDEEIRAAIRNVMDELGISEPTSKDKGKIMKKLMPQVKGKADGGMVNRIVGEMLK